MKAAPPRKSRSRSGRQGFSSPILRQSAIELARHIAVADNFFIESYSMAAFNPGSGLSRERQTPAKALLDEQTYATNFDALTKPTGITHQDHRLSWTLPAGPPFSSCNSVWFTPFTIAAALHLPQTHGQQSSCHLRRKLAAP